MKHFAVTPELLAHLTQTEGAPHKMCFTAFLHDTNNLDLLRHGLWLTQSGPEWKLCAAEHHGSLVHYNEVAGDPARVVSALLGGNISGSTTSVRPPCAPWR